MRFLLVDDEPVVQTLVKTWFEKRGHEILWAEDGRQGLDKATEGEYDAIILDIKMPEMDGTEVLEKLRERGDATPVMMLTSVDAEEHIIDALRLGADGYMTKPFSPPELEARLEALCRRAAPAADAQVELEVGDIRIDRLARSVTRDGKKLRLTNIEFGILSALAADPRQIVSRERLLADVWNMHHDPGTGLVHVHMSHLREKLTSTGGPDPIRTVRGQGYVMDPLLD